MTNKQLTDHLISKYEFGPARAFRILLVARENGLNNEPVADGYVSITAKQRRDSSWEYEIEPHTGPPRSGRNPS